MDVERGGSRLLVWAEQPIDQLFTLVSRVVGQKRLDLLLSRQSSGDVDVDAAEVRGVIADC